MQLSGYFNSQRKYHLEHHYKNWGSSASTVALPFILLSLKLTANSVSLDFVELGFGVTSRFWDWVFRTTYDAAPKAIATISSRRNLKA